MKSPLFFYVGKKEDFSTVLFYDHQNKTNSTSFPTTHFPAKTTKKGIFCKAIFFPHFLSQIMLFHRVFFQPFPQDRFPSPLFHKGKNFSNRFPLSANDGHRVEKACPCLAFFTFPPFQQNLKQILLTYFLSYLFSFADFKMPAHFRMWIFPQIRSFQIRAYFMPRFPYKPLSEKANTFPYPEIRAHTRKDKTS
jgi:hypothetical protein